jgi:hypothetical protein
MAVPQDITTFGATFASSNGGPFFLDGSVWLFINDTQPNGTPAMLRADDPDTASFAEVDAAGAPTNPSDRWGSVAESAGGPSGSDVPIAYAGGTTNEDLFYAVFNTSSETWTLIDENAANNQVDNAAGTNVCLTRRGTGDPIVAGYPQLRKDMGTDYNHIYYARKSSVTGSGGWTSNINVSDGTVNDNHQGLKMCLGGSDRTHFFYIQRTSEDLLNRTLTSGDALQTEAAIDAAIGTYGVSDRGPGQPATYDVGGTIHLNVPYADRSGTAVVNVAIADSADNPSWTIESASDHVPPVTSNDLPAFSCIAIGDVTHLFYVRASDDDIYHDQRDDGGSWGTDTLEITPSSNLAWGPLHLGTYDYGGGDVIGVYYNKSNSQPAYDEFSLAAADPATEIPHPSYPDMARRELRPNLAGMIPGCHKGDEEVV